MPRAYSVDLRERSLQALASGRSVTEVASLFGVSRFTLHRWRRQMVATGDLTPGRPSGRPRQLTPEQEQLVAQQGQLTPDATLDELCAASPVPVSRATMGRTVHRLGLTRQKRP
jgi:transposase